MHIRSAHSRYTELPTHRESPLGPCKGGARQKEHGAAATTNAQGSRRGAQRHTAPSDVPLVRCECQGGRVRRSPVISIPQGVCNERLPLFVLPLPVHDELVLVIPEAGNGERGPIGGTVRVGFPLRPPYGPARDYLRAAGPASAVYSGGRLGSVRYVGAGPSAERSPGRQIANNSENLAISRPVRSHWNGREPIRERAAYVHLRSGRGAGMVRESRLDIALQSKNSLAISGERALLRLSPQLACLPPYGQTKRVGTSSCPESVISPPPSRAGRRSCSDAAAVRARVSSL